MDEQAVYEMNEQQAYDTYTVMCLENPEMKKSYNQIRFGIDLKFDIYKHLRGQVSESEKNNIVRVKGVGEFSMEEYYTEIENRLALMKSEILNNIGDDGDTYARED